MAETGRTPRIECDKDSAVIDQPLNISISGLEPGSECTLGIEVADDLGRTWSIDALYMADSSGQVDVRKKLPANRLFAGEDHMALFSLLDLDIEQALKGPPVFIHDLDKPLDTLLSLQVNGRTVAQKRIARHIAGPEVAIRRFNEEGLLGTLCRPSGDGQHPGALILGGAIGGVVWAERMAAVLASHGFAALALTYYGDRHLSQELVEVPIEYITTAASRLCLREHVDENRFFLIGSSKGAEAALLTATRLPRITAVVCYAAPAVVYQGIQLDGPILTARSSWTWRGKPIPFTPAYQEGSRFSMNTLMQLHALHAANLSSSYIVKRAAIPVEKINAPMLLITGESDRIWPSGTMADMLLERRAAAGNGQRTRHVSYPEAGHSIGTPYLPMYLYGGGTLRGQALADAQAWRETLAFLQEHSS